MSLGRIIFITGTDTGVGKTVLTSLLLGHLRATGKRAVALKPFCSGDRSDALLLRAMAEGELSLEVVNPFYFPMPVAPLVGARKLRQKISLKTVVEHIRRLAGQHECVLVEGAGGLLVPLGEGYSLLDVVRRFDCEVTIAAANRLGTINHTLLTIQALNKAGVCRLKVVLMGVKHPDGSSASNAAVLSELLKPVRLFQIPFLAGGCRSASRTRGHADRLAALLSRVVR